MPDEELKAYNQAVMDKLAQRDPDELKEPAGISISFLVVLGPINVTETTKWLKVYVDTEDETLESFKLMIRQAKPNQPANT